MSRKRCRRRKVVAMPPPGLRAMLTKEQLLRLSLAHVVNLDAIARGDAEPSILWDVIGGTLMWWKVAQQLRIGQDEMAAQLDLATRLVERYGATGKVLFTGLDYQLAKRGVEVMDQLALQVDRNTADAAALWSITESDRMEAAVITHQAAARAADPGNVRIDAGPAA